MRPPRVLKRLPRALLVALALTFSCKRTQPPDEPPPEREAPPDPSDRVVATFAFQGVRVFDGQRVVEDATVLVGENGNIIALGSSRDYGVPDGAEVIDGAGHTLLPGLIDAHTHTWSREDQRMAAAFGVTTELDMFTQPAVLARAKERESSGQARDLAALRSAGILATAPGGHGTEYGFEIPTIERPEDAQAFVDARVAEGSDYIKIVYDDGAAMGAEFPTINRATLAALITAAHARQRLAIVHIGSQQGAIDALEAGADGLAHIFFDSPPRPEFIELAARSVARGAGEERRAFVADTLAVCAALESARFGAELAEDARVAAMLTPAQRRQLASATPLAGNTQLACDNARKTVKALHDAGVPILASTDTPNAGIPHGVGLHGELAQLVRAGLTPIAALTAATSAPAKAFGLDDRGVIREGMRADLVLVKGDPTADITTTRDIVAVWKSGERVDRETYAVRVKMVYAAIERQKRAASPPGAGPGLISDFEDGTAAARFGAGWEASTDALRGGASTATLAVARRGARSRYALEIRGTVDPGLGAIAWAGAMFYPAPHKNQPANLLGRTTISFWARGDVDTLTVMAFATQLGPTPARVDVPITDKWQRHEITFEALGIEPYDLLGLFFGVSGTPGPFTLRLDDVRLEPAVPEPEPEPEPEAESETPPGE